jgi:CubicO group peptidase (beta-lactamase class C family)
VWTVAIALALCAGLAAARDMGSVEVDALFTRWDKPGSPGCAVGVFENGRAVYTRGYGLADLDHSIPNTPDTVFFIGSMGKQFTAACILLLAEEGKLSLDDDVRKYVPELHEFVKPITIRQLIHHTSGLRDFMNLAIQAGHIDTTLTDVAWLSDESVLDMTVHQTSLNFPPGAAISYSNTGYFLLSVICQRLTKRSAPDLAVERLTAPLGMDSTFPVVDARRTIPGRAYGYVPDGIGYRSVAVAYSAPGPAGLWSTVNDLGKWGWALMSDRIGRSGIAAGARRRQASALRRGPGGREAPGSTDGEPRRRLPGVHV